MPIPFGIGVEILGMFLNATRKFYFLTCLTIGTETKRGLFCLNWREHLSNLIHYKFQQRMSRFPQRWRTQRNAICNANCKISWIINILNAHCASGIFPEACLSECQQNQLSADEVFRHFDVSCWSMVVPYWALPKCMLSFVQYEDCALYSL